MAWHYLAMLARLRGDLGVAAIYERRAAAIWRAQHGTR